MNPGDFTNNQLLNLIIMFVCLALGFAGLLVYAFTGFGRQGKKVNKRKQEWIEFKAELSDDQANVESETVVNTEIVEQGKMMNENEKSGGLLKSEGLLKSTKATRTPSAASEEGFRFPSFEAEMPQADTASGEAEAESLAQTVDEAPVPTTVSAPAAKLEAQEVLKVLVNRESGEIIVEVNGQAYETIAQVKDRAIGQRILEVAALLLKFTGGMIATPAGFKMLPAPQAKLTALPPKPKPTAVAQDLSAPKQPVTRQAPANVGSPAMNLSNQSLSVEVEPVEEKDGGGFLGRLLKPDKPLETPGFDLASEIDAVLQQKLLVEAIRIPVKISSGLDGHLRIEVAGQIFTAVDEVEPPDIRSLIQDSIKEWERR